MTPAGERARLAARAKANPDEILAVRARGTRSLRRGGILLATSALAVLALLTRALGDTASFVLALYFAFALCAGAGMLFVGWRRVVLANGAQRLLDQARIPSARVHRHLG